MKTGPESPPAEEQVMIRISERKLLWVLVAVLVALVALEGVMLIRQGNRIDRIENRMRRGRTADSASLGEDGTSAEGVASRGGRSSGRSKARTGWARTDRKARKQASRASTPPEREKPISERLEAFIVANEVDEQSATALRELLQQTQADVQGIRERSVAGELTAEQRKESIQQAFDEAETNAGDIVGDALAEAIAEDVFSFRKRSGASSAAGDADGAVQEQPAP